MRKESAPDGLQGHRRRRRIINDLDIEHEEMVVLTTLFVNHDSRVFWRILEVDGVPQKLGSCGDVS